MKKKIILGVILLIIIVPQLISVDKPEIDDNKSHDLISNNEIPENISNLIKTSCYDCHSMQTIYPWYSNIAPVSWLVIRDVKLGREELNFSNWENYSKMDKAKLLEEIAEEIEEGEMAMPVYLITHPNAKLNSKDKKAIKNWAESQAENLFSN